MAASIIIPTQQDWKVVIPRVQFDTVASIEIDVENLPYKHLLIHGQIRSTGTGTSGVKMTVNSIGAGLYDSVGLMYSSGSVSTNTTLNQANIDFGIPCLSDATAGLFMTFDAYFWDFKLTGHKMGRSFIQKPIFGTNTSQTKYANFAVEMNAAIDLITLLTLSDAFAAGCFYEVIGLEHD